MSRSSSWTSGSKYQKLEARFLTEYVPLDIAKLLAAKGLLTLADLLNAAVREVEAANIPLSEMGLSTYIERRLLSRGYTTVGSTDTLSAERITVFFLGLGKGAVSEINEARGRFGRRPLPKH